MSAFLTDFGLAKLAVTGSKLTKSGEALGTPAYMSPEQARGEVSSLTPATDVWSLGCVLYEMLAGRAAFEGETPAAVVGQVLLRDPPALRTLRPETPRAVERVIRVCLGKGAGDRSAWLTAGRYGDAAALREDLDRVLRGELPRARIRRRRGALSAALALVAGLAAGGGLALRPRPEAAGPRPAPDSVSSEAESLAARSRALRASDPRRAGELIARALELEPGRDDWRIERGLLLWAVGEGREAVEEWGRVGEGSAEAPRARLYEGLEPLFRLEDREPVPALRRAAKDPGLPGCLARGALKLIERDWSGAREELREGRGWEAALLRGYIEDKDPAGDRNRAVREYGAAMEEGIQFGWAWYNRGRVRQIQGDHPGAIEDYDRAITVDPRYARAWTNRGVARAAVGNLSGAIEDHSRALELDPKYVAAWQNRGLARKARGDLPGALEDLSTALKLDPESVGAWLNRGIMRRDDGDLAGAVADFGKALEADPSDARPWNNRGVTRQAQGDLLGAIEDFDRALELDPKMAEAWSNRGAARRIQGDLAGAIQDYETAVEVNPAYMEAWNDLGVARQAQGDIPKAAECYERALSVAPPDWKHRGTTEANLSRIRAALAAQRGGR